MRRTLICVAILVGACTEPQPYVDPIDAPVDVSAGGGRDTTSTSADTASNPDAAAGLDGPVQPDGPSQQDVSAETSPDRPPVIDVAADTTLPVDAPAPPPDLGSPIDAVVLFDEAHEVFPKLDGWWARFSADLTADGHTVRVHKMGPLTPAVLATVNVLVIGTGWGAYTSVELDTIDNFVKSGGRLFITGLGWSWVNPAMSRTLENYPMNQIAGRFGVTFMDGWIQDPTNFDIDSGKPIFTVTGTHPITRGVQRIGGGISPAPLRVTAPMAELVVRGDQDATDLKSYYKPGELPPVLVAVQHGQGRVVALGHEGYFGNDDVDNDGVQNIDEYDNRQLGRNIIQFLAGYR